MTTPAPPTSTRRRTFTIAAILLAVVAAAGVAVTLARSDSDDPPAPSGAPTTTAPPDVEAAASDDYAWAPVPIGGGGFVTGIVSGVDGDAPVVYARTDVGGAYRWDEATTSWTQLVVSGSVTGGRVHASDYSVASIAVAPSDPDVVVLAAGDDYNPNGDDEGGRNGRVLWSTDGGASWSAGDQRWSIAGNQSFRVGREQLAIDPTDARRALFGTQREGLWVTDDAGSTWRQIPLDEVPDGGTDDPTSDQSGVSSVAYVASHDGAAPVAVVGVAGDGIYVSADLRSWERVLELGDGDIPSSAAPFEDGIVLSIMTPGRGDARLVRLGEVASEALGGITVEDVPTPGSAWSWIVAAAPGSGGATLSLTDEAVRDGHLWTSDDAGSTWRVQDVEIVAPTEPWLTATDLDDYMSAGALMFDPVVPDRLWFAEGMGVWRTDAPDAEVVTWTSVSQGIEEVVVSDIVLPPGGDLLVTVADRQGFRLTDPDTGPTRTLVDERFASGSSLDYSAGTPQRLAWVGMQSHLAPSEAQPRAATSTDGGGTWVEMGALERSMFGGEVAVDATDPDRIVWVPAHHDGRDPRGVLVSSDGARTWSTVDAGGDEMDVHRRNAWWFGRRALAADRVDGSFYLLSDDERLDVSTDGGATWEPAAHAPPCRVDTDCHVFGQLRAVPGRAGQLVASTGRGGLFATTDAGTSAWRELGAFTDARAVGFGAPIGDSEHPAIYLHGTTEEHPHLALWRSTDGGEQWTLVADHPGGIAAGVNAVAGDPEVPGRVYVGFGGVGVVRGDDTTLGG